MGTAGNPKFKPITATTRDNTRRKRAPRQVPAENMSTYGKAHLAKIPTSTRQKRKR